MNITTRDELIGAVRDYTLRQDSPVELFIGLFENTVKSLVKHNYSETVIDIPIVDGKVTLPADFLEARSITVDNFKTRQLGIRDSHLYPNEVGYRRVGRQLHFVGQTDIDAVQIIYYAKIESLSDDNPSNWLLENFPKVYFHGTLAEAYRWARDDVAEGVEKQSLTEALAVVAEDFRANSKPAAPSNFGGSAW